MEYKSYYKSGKLKQHYFFVKDVLNGEYKFYLEDGKLHHHCFYNRSLNGEYIDYGI